MLAPVHRLKKAEIVQLARGRCKHGHSFLAHYNCWVDEHPEAQEKIGFLDIESTNLKADFGIILSWCLVPMNGDVIMERSITAKELKTVLDRNVVEAAIKTISQFDRIVGHYSTRFDLPFLRSRALANKLDFPKYGQIKTADTWLMAKYKLKISSNRLENVARFLFGETEKTRIDSLHWTRALMGNKEALDYILDHCRRDVRDLKRVYLSLMDFSRRADNSI